MSGSTPTISVLFPVYNAERYLAEALHSVLDQTYTDFEIIAFDDGSSDGSLAILKDVAEGDERVVVRTRENRGLVATLNESIGLARGRYLARMDADDACLPQRFAKQVAYLDAHDDTAMVGGAVEITCPLGVQITVKHCPADHDGIVAKLRDGDGQALIHPAVMIRKTAIDAVGGYDATWKHLEDLDLFYRLSSVGRLVNLDDIVLRYRMHPGSVNGQNAAYQRQRVREWVEQVAVGQPVERTLPLETLRHHTPADRYRQWSWNAIVQGNRRAALSHWLATLKHGPQWQDAKRAWFILRGCPR